MWAHTVWLYGAGNGSGSTPEIAAVYTAGAEAWTASWTAYSVDGTPEIGSPESSALAPNVPLHDWMLPSGEGGTHTKYDGSYWPY